MAAGDQPSVAVRRWSVVTRRPARSELDEARSPGSLALRRRRIPRGPSPPTWQLSSRFCRPRRRSRRSGAPSAWGRALRGSLAVHAVRRSPGGSTGHRPSARHGCGRGRPSRECRGRDAHRGRRQHAGDSLLGYRSLGFEVIEIGAAGQRAAPGGGRALQSTDAATSSSRANAAPQRRGRSAAQCYPGNLRCDSRSRLRVGRSSDVDGSRLRAAARRVEDWGPVVDLAREQGLAALLHARLETGWRSRGSATSRLASVCDGCMQPVRRSRRTYRRSASGGRASSRRRRCGP